MIYFLQRVDGDIKIGTTIRFHQRFLTLEAQYGKLVLLGVKDGGKAEEHEVHLQFASDRVEHEFFHPSSDLSAYIHDHTDMDFDSRSSSSPKYKNPFVMVAIRGGNHRKLTDLKLSYKAEFNRNVAFDEVINILLDKLEATREPAVP